MGSLFGGGGGGGQTSTTTTVKELSPEQRKLINLVIPTAEQFVKNPPKLFPGSAIQPLDPLQVQAQQNVEALGSPSGPLAQFGNQAVNASNFLLGPVLFPKSNPALQAATDAAVRPLTENFTNTVLPNIRQGAITAGGFGGSRQGIAEGLASQGLLRQVGDVGATVQANAFQKSLNAMTRALFAAPQTAQLPLLPSKALEAVGSQKQAFAQSQLSEQAQKFLAEQLIPFSTAQDVAALAFGIPGGKTTSTAQTSGGGSSGLSSILGIAGLLAGIGGSFFGAPGLGAGLGAGQLPATIAI